MDTKTPEARSNNMSLIRSSKTIPEKYISSLLHRKGFRFRTNYKLIVGKPDIYFTKKKVAVFINGCFWHQHLGCKFASTPKSNTEYWNSKLHKNLHRDQYVIEKLNQLGVRVLIIWECTINKMKRNEKIRDEDLYMICDYVVNGAEMSFQI